MRRLVAAILLLPLIAEARLPDLIPYRKGELWGYCDSTKKIIIEPQWDRAGMFGTNSAVVEKGGREGLIDRTGKIIVQPIYSWIDQDEHCGVRLLSLVGNKHYGAVNSLGKIVVAPKYEWICWQGAFLETMKHCKVGVFDTAGRVVIPFIYKSCGDFPQSMGDSGQFAMCYKKKWGVVDTAGKIIIPFSYYWVTATDCGRWEVRTDFFTSMYYDTRGNYLGDTLSCKTELRDWSYHQLKNGMQSFVGEDKLIGFKDANGKVVYEPQFVTAYDFEPNGLAFVGFRTGACETCFGKGYIDRHGTRYWEE